MNVVFSCEQRRQPPARITDYEDCLLLIRPHRVLEWKHPDGNIADAVRADVVVLDGEDSPLVLTGLTVIQGALVGALKRRLGTVPTGGQVTTLARLAREPGKRNPQNRVWVFEEPTETDVELAQMYLDEHGDPFAAAA